MSSLPRTSEIFKHGEHIFVYCNIRTNQIIYSLSRSMSNNHSLKQIPQLGKKSRPSALRKDLWRPFAHLQFPHPQLGLQIYHKIREFRRLHEMSYSTSSILAHPKTHETELTTPFIPKEQFVTRASHKNMPPIGAAAESKNGARMELEAKSEDAQASIPSSSILAQSSPTSNTPDEPTLEPIYLPSPPALLPKKKRQHVLMNQKPNTVADIAAALLIASRPTPRHILVRRARMERAVKSPNYKLRKRGPGSRREPDPGERWEGGVQGVKIGWADVRDVDYAEQWPEEVEHADGMEQNRYTVSWPKFEGVDAVELWEGRGGKWYQRRKKIEGVEQGSEEEDEEPKEEDKMKMAA